MIDEETAYIIDRAFASYIKDKKVLVVRYNRKSSPNVHEFLIKGLIWSGANIIDLGETTTSNITMRFESKTIVKLLKFQKEFIKIINKI